MPRFSQYRVFFLLLLFLLLSPTVLSEDGNGTQWNDTVVDDDGSIPPQACNITYYKNWLQRPLTDFDVPLASDPGFFSITKYDLSAEGGGDGGFDLRMGEAISILSIKCLESMRQLELDLAGKHGPVSTYDIYGVMCSDYCLKNDQLRNDFLVDSGCSCLELSTQVEDVSYSIEGDWCRKNSGRIMCDVLDRCGVWECDINDFMCPRYEYNKMDTPLRGLGDCEAAGSMLRPTILTVLILGLGFLLSM